MSLLYDQFCQNTPLDREAIIQQGAQRWSCREFLSLVDSFVGEFKSNGLKPGQLVVIKGPNDVLHLACLLACSKLSLVYVPIFEGTSEVEVLSRLEVLCPACVVRVNNKHKWQIQYFYKEEVVTAGADVGGILFATSGSTSQPKFVFQSQESLLQNAQRAAAFQNINPDSRVWCQLTFSHTGGLNMQVLPGLLSGARLVIEADINHLPNVNCTHLILVPTQWNLLGRKAWWKKFKFSDSPLVLTGSSPVPQNLFVDIQNKGGRAVGVYGLTEIGPFLCTAPNSVELPEGAVSLLGTPLKEFEFQIHEPTGELWIKGPCVGALWDAENKSLISLINKQGWFQTGDQVLEANGAYYFIERLKLIINVGGFKVSPSEVEAELLQCEGVKRCVVLSSPHEYFGEVPHAYIVGDESHKQKIMQTLRGRLSPHKIPRRLFFVKNLPETSIGKNVYGHRTA